MADPRQGEIIGGTNAAVQMASGVGGQAIQTKKTRVFDESMNEMVHTLERLSSIATQATEMRERLFGVEPQAIESDEPTTATLQSNCKSTLESFQREFRITVQHLEDELARIQSF